MPNCKCQCGKIVCEIDEDKVIVKCRHCKRFVIIHTKGLSHIEYQTGKELIDLTADSIKMVQITAEKE